MVNTTKFVVSTLKRFWISTLKAILGGAAAIFITLAARSAALAPNTESAENDGFCTVGAIFGAKTNHLTLKDFGLWYLQQNFVVTLNEKKTLKPTYLGEFLMDFKNFNIF